MPPTRREQLELDELLSDIYRGIETLPDKSAANYHQAGGGYSSKPNSLYSRTHVKEYELPGSSPLVRQHKQDIAALRAAGNEQVQVYSTRATSPTGASKQPQRSTLKRQTPDQLRQHQQSQPQSLASFVTSTTPENKRRVRIVEHPDRLAKGYTSDDYDDSADNNNKVDDFNQRRQPKVKHVNTNKLIYHQEKSPEDFIDERESDVDENKIVGDANNNEDEDDIDGVTRVEYYHTTWLDRQLGRASKRRSSKELNERQVKEKAMIEELKRSLKNGAITLRQSFKGKRGNKSNKSGETYDDQILDSPVSSNSRYKESAVFGSGLATIPRNYQSNSSKSNSIWNSSMSRKESPNKQQTNRVDNERKETFSSSNAPKQTTTSVSYNSNTLSGRSSNRQQESVPMQLNNQQASANYSKTLPHNHHSPKRSEHQLLQSHYRGNINNSNTLRPSAFTTTSSTLDNNMRNPSSYQNNHYANSNTMGPIKSPSYQPNSNHQQAPQTANTISSIPSATEVVRSALSRSNSPTGLSQLNKTINLLPNSPPPYAQSPMTPTQSLRACTPSLSPSPVRSPTQYLSKTLGPHERVQTQQQQRLYGTRTLDRSPQQQQQQPVYANPHASLIQHRIDQQTRQPIKNNASIREFNELDSLLRSLSPSSTHITPGFTSKPTQPTFGGYAPVSAQPQPLQQQHQQPRANVAANSPVVYAKVQKPPVSNHQAPGEQTKANYLQQQFGLGQPTQTHQPFTIDATERKDENCQQRQGLSEFEPPTDLVPSMEDYQNISKLNPVKNHYWYKPKMTREEAIYLLKDKPQGTFIVRDSTSYRGAYGLAVKVAKLPKNVLNNASLRNPSGDPSAELIRHFLIEPTSNGVRVKGYANEPVFGSLPSLIYQHSLTELALPCKLVIPRADIEDREFNHKQKQFYDDFLASKELARHGPYDRTSPNGGYRKYPGDVYIHNEHRVIFE